MMSMVSSFSINGYKWKILGHPWGAYFQTNPGHPEKPSFVGVAGMVHHSVPLGVVLCHDMRWRGDGHVDVVIWAEEKMSEA